MKGPIRLGIIGCGDHALRGHVKIALSLPEYFSIAGLYDVDDIALNAMAEIATNARTFESAEALITDSGIDAIIIASPPPFHLEVLEGAVKARKHVLCEKPLWEGIDKTVKGIKIIMKARRRRLVLTSCHPRRFEVGPRRLLDNLGAYIEQYGEPKELHFRFFYPEVTAEWRKKDSLLLDHLNHEIDVTNFVLGPAAVDLKRVHDAFDAYLVTGTRRDGVLLSFGGYRRLPTARYTNELTLVFERGRIVASSARVGALVMDYWAEEDFASGIRMVEDLKQHSAEDSHRGVMLNFAKAILGEEANYLTRDDLITNTISGNTLVATGAYHS